MADDAPVSIDDLTGPELRDLFRDIDDAYQAASAAFAANDMDEWVEHAARGAALYERAARLNGWRDQPPARRTEQGWRCARCGSPKWVAASLTGPVVLGGRAIKQCVPCGHYSNDPATGETETPESCATSESEPGTYWERAVLERFVTGGPVDLTTVRQQVGALLGEIRPPSETPAPAALSRPTDTTGETP
jgi:hypothetical protein